MEINSSVSGRPRKVGLYALPNPAELHSPDFDMNSLVPILIGMDHLSSPSSAMTIDFMTGLALDSFQAEPMVYQLASNQKGRIVLDIVYFLTRGHTNSSGHPQVHVMEAATIIQHEENHFIQFMPLELDAHVQKAHNSHYTYGSEKLQKSHQNLLKLHRSLHRFHSSQPCYGSHQAAKPRANPLGPRVHCRVCNLRLEYTPRLGAAAQTTKVENEHQVISHAAGTGDYAGRSSSVSGALFGNAKEGGCRDAAGGHGGQAPFKPIDQVFRHTVQGQGEAQSLSSSNIKCNTLTHGGGACGDDQLCS